MTTTAPTLLDEVLPRFEVRSRHERRVAATPDRVVRVVESLRLGGASSLLLRIRGVRLPPGPIRDVLRRSGFAVLAERPGVEVVAGTTGRFWAIRGRTAVEAPPDLEAFRAFDRPGCALGAISLRVDGLGNGSTLVSTETRVRCVDDRARRRFAVYWSLIRVFSGWLRRDLLRRIARASEAAA